MVPNYKELLGDRKFSLIRVGPCRTSRSSWVADNVEFVLGDVCSLTWINLCRTAQSCFGHKLFGIRWGPYLQSLVGQPLQNCTVVFGRRLLRICVG